MIFFFFTKESLTFFKEHIFLSILKYFTRDQELICAGFGRQKKGMLKGAASLNIWDNRTANDLDPMISNKILLLYRAVELIGSYYATAISVAPTLWGGGGKHALSAAMCRGEFTKITPSSMGQSQGNKGGLDSFLSLLSGTLKKKKSIFQQTFIPLIGCFFFFSF